MGRIVVAHPLAPECDAAHEHDGPLIDWLRANYPAGFDGQARAALNGMPLPAEDWDAPIGPGDELRLVVMPGAQAVLPVIAFIQSSWWASAIASAVVGMAATYAINAIFGSKPKKPASLLGGGAPSPSPTYSLGPPRVDARLGGTIPLQYGRVVAVPDYASAPYTWYSGNQQYVSFILELGHGDIGIHEVYFSDTPVSQMRPGIVSYAGFTPAQHGGVYGTIQALTGIYEDVDTSAEVSDQMMNPSQYDSYPVSIDLINSRLYRQDGGYFLVAPIGAEVTLANAPPNSGVYSIAACPWPCSYIQVTPALSAASFPWTESTVTALLAFGDPLSLSLTWASGNNSLGAYVGMRISGTLNAEVPIFSVTFAGVIVSAAAGEAEIRLDYETTLPEFPRTFGTATASISPATTGIATIKSRDSAVGPFAACAPNRRTTRIGIDYEFPGGAYNVDDNTGNLTTAYISAQWTCEPIDDAGNPTGGTSIVRTVEHYLSTNTPQRFTIWVDVPFGRYRVSADRTSPESARAQDQSKLYWTGLKAVLPHDGEQLYGDVTLLAVNVRASEGLSSNALDRVTVDCTRYLSAGPSSNPADCVQDLWTNAVYGGGYDLDLLDSVSLEAMRAAAVGHNGFNGRFDSPNTIWDAIQAICRPIGWYPVPLGPQLTFVADEAQALDQITFTEAMLSNLTVSYLFDRPPVADGYEVEYRSATTGQALYVRYPTDSVVPERVTLFGCTDETVAAREAQSLWLRKQYRRRRFSFDAELDGHLIEIGKRARLQHAAFGLDLPVVPDQVEAIDELHTRVRGFVYDARAYP